MEKEFRFFKLALAARLVLTGGLYALGAALELFLGLPLVVGAAFAVAGWFPLMLRRATNRPDDKGLEEWRPVTMAEIDRIDQGLRETRKLRAKLISPSAILMLVIALPLTALTWLIGLGMGRGDLVFAAIHFGLFSVPALFFGHVGVFMPKEIALKMPCFRPLLGTALPQGLALAPYLRFDKDGKGKDVPEDLRFLLEAKRSPADLVGIQFQAAVNKGPNGEVPYLYAVVLTKGAAGATHEGAARFRHKGFEVEAGGDGDYGTVVIRQATGGRGYYTDPGDCERLFGLCVDLLGRLAAGGGH